MNINITILGQFIVAFAILIGVASYYLGRRKTETPKLAALLGFVLSIVPILGLVYVVALMFKKDISNRAESESSV